MKIEYRDAYPAWEEFKELVISVVKNYQVRSIVEIGAGANPLLPISFVEDQQLVYQLIDFSGEELAKAGKGAQLRRAVEYVAELGERMGGLEKEVEDLRKEKQDLEVSSSLVEPSRKR
ncbi:MAG: hypothetical protein EOO05_13790 [Chitinophagaceae bacterium]|nr:MAG: hypothetical protein EOO05_13790 [Chitinophagaceae bacterium]